MLHSTPLTHFDGEGGDLVWVVNVVPDAETALVLCHHHITQGHPLYGGGTREGEEEGEEKGEEEGEEKGEEEGVGQGRACATSVSAYRVPTNLNIGAVAEEGGLHLALHVHQEQLEHHRERVAHCHTLTFPPHSLPNTVTHLPHPSPPTFCPILPHFLTAPPLPSPSPPSSSPSPTHPKLPVPEEELAACLVQLSGWHRVGQLLVGGGCKEHAHSPQSSSPCCRGRRLPW